MRDEHAVAGVMTCMIIISVAICFAFAHQRNTLRREAVERGFAEWVVKPDGSTVWKWKGGEAKP